jgi:hypothetical protein
MDSEGAAVERVREALLSGVVQRDIDYSGERPAKYS